MFSLDSLKEIQIIKQNDRQKITLTEDFNGKKYLLKEIEGDKREIYKVLQKISCQGIPKIQYVGFEDKTIVVEEYIKGESLSHLLEQKKELRKSKILSISKELLSVLSVLHEHHLIHKDIKPDNILIDEVGRLWLIDYDIARIYRRDIRKDTETMGTFGYAPIEQFGMLPTDYKTDIYAFGMTLKTLLDAENIQGFLRKIAEKCTRLDPAQRYKNAMAVKKAITFGSLKKYIFVAGLFLILVLLLCCFSVNKTNNGETKEVTPPEQSFVPSVAESTQKSNTTADVRETATPGETEQTDFEGTFYGFACGTNEAIYRKYAAFSNACIFSTVTPREHIIFVDDMTSRGKLKLGANHTVIDAEMTLSEGRFSVRLNDGKGHTFTHEFSYAGQYEYEKNYESNLRKNADIICHDLDADGDTELLIGLNEGSIGVVEDMFYNNFNYCIAWCIEYDEASGFTLCEGDMFSKGSSFWINNYSNRLNVHWEEIGDISNYRLVDGKIVGSF